MRRPVSKKERRLASLEYRFKILTRDLKDMDFDKSSFIKKWDERAEISREISQLKKEISVL